MKYIDIETSIR